MFSVQVDILQPDVPSMTSSQAAFATQTAQATLATQQAQAAQSASYHSVRLCIASGYLPCMNALVL